MRRLFTNANGDTIIEVLIAIVILALVLTGAYASSQQSLDNITEAGQRTKALDIAQQQIEILRAEAATAAFSSFTTSDSCYNVTDTVFVSYSLANCTSGGYTSEISPVVVATNPGAVGVKTYEITVSYSSTANHSSNDQVILYYTVATS